MVRSYVRILGRSHIEIRGSRPERALNVLAARSVPFTSAELSGDGALSLACPKRFEHAVFSAASDCGLEARMIKRLGILWLVSRFRKRYALLAALFAVVLTAYFASLFIWEVRVEGNVGVPSGEIRAALEESGYGVGCFGPYADREYAASYVRMKVGRLSWVGINVKGCVMTVIVRERREPPPVLDVGAPCDLAAAKTGVVVSVDDFSGQRLVEPGDTVLKGQKLVSGELFSLGGERRLVRSFGSVRARTWYELSAVMPLECSAKSYTEREFEKTALIIGDLRVNLYINSRILNADCDNIIFDGRAELFGVPLPAARSGTKLREYEKVPRIMPAEEAGQVLREDLSRRLRDMLCDGEVVSESYETVSDGGSVRVTLRAECIEEIAREVPLIQTREEEPDQ